MYIINKDIKILWLADDLSEEMNRLAIPASYPIAQILTVIHSDVVMFSHS